MIGHARRMEWENTIREDGHEPSRLKETGKTKTVMKSRRRVRKEMGNVGKTWSETEKIAKYRVWWRAMMKSRCMPHERQQRIESLVTFWQIFISVTAIDKHLQGRKRQQFILFFVESLLSTEAELKYLAYAINNINVLTQSDLEAKNIQLVSRAGKRSKLCDWFKVKGSLVHIPQTQVQDKWSCEKSQIKLLSRMY